MKRVRDGGSSHRERSTSRHDYSDGDDNDQDKQDKRSKADLNLDLGDIGAGYSIEEKRVIEAVRIYKEQLVPFFQDKSSIMRRSNYFSIRGYGTGVQSTAATTNTTTPNTSPTKQEKRIEQTAMTD